MRIRKSLGLGVDVVAGTKFNTALGVPLAKLGLRVDGALRDGDDRQLKRLFVNVVEELFRDVARRNSMKGGDV